MNQRSHEGSPRPADSVTGSRQGTHLEKRVRYSGPGVTRSVEQPRVSELVGIDHVQVAAPSGCEADARRFYGGLLGLDEVSKPPLLEVRGGVWFRLGAQELHIGVSDTFAPATKAHPALLARSVDALDRLAETLVHAGVDVRWADADEVPGTRRFFVNDPWGNRLELVASRV